MNFGKYKISLPSYVYQSNVHWLKYLEVSTAQEFYSKGNKGAFIQCPIVKTEKEDIFECSISAQKNFVLSDHVIMGRPTLPGTAYLEMACEIGAYYFMQKPIEMQDFRFKSPVIISSDKEKVIQITARREKDTVQLNFSSLEGGIWLQHAAVKLNQVREEKMDLFDIPQMIADSSEITTIELNSLTKGFIEFGKHWLIYDRLYQRGNTGLAYIELPEEYMCETNDYILHPSMTDIGVNALCLILGKPYLPLYYKKILVYQRIEGKIYSYVRPSGKEDESDETKTYDISFINPKGERVADFEGYTVKKVKNVERIGKQITFSGIDWVEEKGIKQQETGNVLLFGGDCEWSEQVEQYMKMNRISFHIVREGNSCEFYEKESVITYDENGYQQLLLEQKERKRSFEQIVFMSGGKNEFSSITQEIETRVHKLMDLAKVICKSTQPIYLSVITKNAFYVHEEDKVSNPVASMASALCKTLHAENRMVYARTVDFDDYFDSADLIKELQYKNFMGVTAYRKNLRYGQQADILSTETLPENHEVLKKEGAYIITGGKGGIGRSTAYMLASHQQIKLILVSRNKFWERSKWSDIISNDSKSEDAEFIRTIMEIEKMGSQIFLYQADIADEAQVESLLSWTRQEAGEIKGIVHCAGVSGAGLIKNKEWSEMCRILNPKVCGTYYLEKHTQEDPLDFILLCSSIASLLGIPGQVDYSMANTYLDNFVNPFCQSERAVMTVNWPAWNDIGMAVKHNNVNEKYIYSIDADYGMTALWEILRKKIRHTIVGNWNKTDLKSETVIKYGKRLLRELEEHNSDGNNRPDRKLKPVVLEGKTEHNYSADEQKIAEIWGNVLGLTTVNVYDNFNDIGGNSIFAVNMLELLNVEYEGYFDVTDMFSYGSVYELAEHVRECKEETNKDKVESENANKDLEDMLEQLSKGVIDISDLDELI